MIAETREGNTGDDGEVFFSQCPLCDEPESVRFVEYPQLAFVRCVSCKLIYKKRQEEHLTTHYDEDYFTGHRARFDKRWRHRVDKCERQLRACQRFARLSTLLDIGCSTGYMLQAAQNLGIEALGIDVSPWAVETCQQRGLKAQLGSFTEMDFEPGSFDIITTKHSLEHEHDPMRAIRNIARLLREGGIAFVIVPDADYIKRYFLPKYWGSYFKPSGAGLEHHVYYSEVQLVTALEKANLVSIRRGKAIYRRHLAFGIKAPWEMIRFVSVLFGSALVKSLHLRREIQVIALKDMKS